MWNPRHAATIHAYHTEHTPPVRATPHPIHPTSPRRSIPPGNGALGACHPGGSGACASERPPRAPHGHLLFGAPAWCMCGRLDHYTPPPQPVPRGPTTGHWVYVARGRRTPRRRDAPMPTLQSCLRSIFGTSMMSVNVSPFGEGAPEPTVVDGSANPPTWGTNKQP